MSEIFGTMLRILAIYKLKIKAYQFDMLFCIYKNIIKFTIFFQKSLDSPPVVLK